MKYQNRERKQNMINGKKVAKFIKGSSTFHKTELTEKEKDKRTRNKRLTMKYINKLLNQNT